MGCKNCEGEGLKVSSGYRCSVLDGVFGAAHACPPSVIGILRRA